VAIRISDKKSVEAVFSLLSSAFSLNEDDNGNGNGNGNDNDNDNDDDDAADDAIKHIRLTP
jgi:hypothetical protein